MEKWLDKVINKIADAFGADPITVVTRIFEGGVVAGILLVFVLIFRLFI